MQMLTANVMPSRYDAIQIRLCNKLMQFASPWVHGACDVVEFDWQCNLHCVHATSLQVRQPHLAPVTFLIVVLHRGRCSLPQKPGFQLMSCFHICSMLQNSPKHLHEHMRCDSTSLYTEPSHYRAQRLHAQNAYSRPIDGMVAHSLYEPLWVQQTRHIGLHT